MPKSKSEPKEEIKEYTEEEMMKIMEALEEDLMIYCWIRILAETGTRPSEPLALQWKDINWEEGSITIDKTLSEVREHDLENWSRSRSVPIIKTLKNDGVKRTHCRKISISAGLMVKLRQWQKFVENDEKMREGRIRNNTTEQVLSLIHI